MKNKKLSYLVRNLVDKETKEINAEVAKEIVSRIEGAVELATGLNVEAVREKLGDCPAYPDSEVPVEHLDPEGLAYVILNAHKKAIVKAVNSNDPVAIERQLGLLFAKDNYLMTALTALGEQEDKSNLF